MLKKAKTILLKALFYVMAFQILNLSIDIDYIVYNTSNLSAAADYDDIDSFAELISEAIAGDSN